MAKRCVRSWSALVAVAVSGMMASTAAAQEAPRSQSADIPTAINQVFYGNSGDFFHNRTLGRNLDFILGTGGFSEREISMDANALNRAASYLMEQQNTSDPTIRVPDLFNPYNTSVQFLPTTQTGGRVSGSEFVFESIPMP